MQVFIPFASPLGVARSLDIKRLRKQIIEVGQILKAIETGAGSWRNHPVVKMYRDHTDWLRKPEALAQRRALEGDYLQLRGRPDPPALHHPGALQPAQAQALHERPGILLEIP